jgi:predicted Kef-type K+ transport protein
VGLSLFVLIGNPLVVLIIMGMLGYTKKTSFKAGLAVAQVSEFSLIFMSMGLESGKLDKQAVSLVTLVGFITIAFSSYMIIYADKLYIILQKKYCRIPSLLR